MAKRTKLQPVKTHDVLDRRTRARLVRELASDMADVLLDRFGDEDFAGEFYEQTANMLETMGFHRGDDTDENPGVISGDQGDEDLVCELLDEAETVLAKALKPIVKCGKRKGGGR